MTRVVRTDIIIQDLHDHMECALNENIHNYLRNICNGIPITFDAFRKPCKQQRKWHSPNKLYRKKHQMVTTEVGMDRAVHDT